MLLRKGKSRLNVGITIKVIGDTSNFLKRDMKEERGTYINDEQKISVVICCTANSEKNQLQNRYRSNVN